MWPDMRARSRDHGPMTSYTHVESPIGRLLLVGRPGVLTGLYVADHDGCRPVDPTWVEDAAPFAAIADKVGAWLDRRVGASAA